MSFRSKYDRDGSAQIRGDQGESNFKAQAEKEGCDPVASSEAENRRHIDWHLTINGKRTTCDSKARKALDRGGPLQDEYLLLEKTNVGGRPGWIHGEAEYIGFEQEHRFILCPRLELVKLWDEIVDETILAKKASLALGVIFQRRDRLDCISYVKTTDVEKRPGVIIWEKK